MRNKILYVFRKFKIFNSLHRFLPFEVQCVFDSKLEIEQIQNAAIEKINISIIQNSDISLMEYNVKFPAQKIYNINDVLIFRENGALMDKNKNLYSNTYKGKELTHYNFYYNFDFFKCPLFVKKRATFLYAPTNYWHFHVEFLSKLILIKNTYPEILIYSNQLLYKWQEEALLFYKIPKEKIIFTKEKQNYIRFKNYIYLDFFGTDYLGFNSKSSSVLLQNEILSRIQPTTSRKKRLYISRKNANTRKIINEDNLIQLLKLRNFEIVTIEDLSIENQYLLFSKSEVIIAQHGACLTNMLAVKNSTIIELFNPEWPMNMYSLMSEATENNFYRINISEFEGNDPQSANYSVNISDVDFLLNKLGF